MTFITVRKIDVGRETGGVINGFDDEDSFTGGFLFGANNSQDLRDTPEVTQAVIEGWRAIIGGSFITKIQGLTPTVEYAIDCYFSSYDVPDSSYTFEVSANGSAPVEIVPFVETGGISFKTFRKRLFAEADSSGEITILAQSKTGGAYLPALIVKRDITLDGTETTVVACVVDSIMAALDPPVTASFPYLEAIQRNADYARYTATPDTNYQNATLTDIISNAAKIKVFNLGISSRPAIGFSSTKEDEVGTKFSGKTFRELLLMGGLNDLGALTAVDTVKSALSGISDFAAGYDARFFISTLTPVGLGYPGNTQSVVDYVNASGKNINAWMRTRFPANQIVPLDENIHFLDAANGTHFDANRVHLTTAGLALWHDIYQRVRNGTYTKPVITTTLLNDATEGVASQQVIDVTGASAYQILSGAMPSGWSFNASTKRFEGVITESGDFTFEFAAVASDGTFASRVYNLHVVVGAGGLVNYARTSQGATAMANSTYSDGGYDGAASNAINGDRLFSYANWSASGGIYHSDGAGAVLTIDFNQSRTIEKLNLITVRDSGTSKTAIPDSNTENIGSFGLAGFTVDYWNGTTWTNLFAPVTGNTKLFRSFTFTPVATTKIRITATSAGSARIAEVEALGTSAGGGVNAKRIRCFWGEASGNPDGYKIRKIVQTADGDLETIIDAGLPEIIAGEYQYFDTDVVEGDDLTYEYAAYKGATVGNWTAVQAIEFTNN